MLPWSKGIYIIYSDPVSPNCIEFLVLKLEKKKKKETFNCECSNSNPFWNTNCFSGVELIRGASGIKQ